MSTTDDDAPDFEIGDQSWTNPFTDGTPLHDLFGRRVRQGRDLVIIIDDWDAGRGTGKTIASLQLAEGMDQTEDGITTDKATMHPERLITAYKEQPERSALILDEAEAGASNREAMTNVNKALRRIVSMGRVKKKYVVLNAPAVEFIDKDLQKLADVWISMTRKGAGLVHFFERQPYSGQLLTPKKQTISFNDVPIDHRLRSVYQSLTQSKIQGMDGDGEGFLTEEEAEQRVEQAVKQAKREQREQIIYNLDSHPDVDATQQTIADCTGVTQGTISNIISRLSDDY